MARKCDSIRGCFFLFLFLLCTSSLYGIELRYYSVKEGLTDEKVSFIHQDENRLMWFATNSGVCTFDGLSFQSLPFKDNKNPFDDQSVISIYEAELQQFWIQTQDKLYLYDKKAQTVESFDEFDASCKVIVSPQKKVFVLKTDNILHYYSTNGTFQKVAVEGLTKSAVLDILVDSWNVLWVFTNDGKPCSYDIDDRDEQIVINELGDFEHPASLLWCFHEKNQVLFVDNTYTLFHYDISTNTKDSICELSQQIKNFGEVTSIIKQERNFFVSLAGGLLIKAGLNEKKLYVLNETLLSAPILCMYSDPVQQILWAGTDGEGVGRITNEAPVLDVLSSKNMGFPINHSITSVFIDNNKTMWLGTDGDGLICINDTATLRNKTKYLLFDPNNSLLNSKNVFAIAGSKKQILWIGTDKGLNYYSYQDEKIKLLQVLANGKPLKSVRALCEQNDSILWIASQGEGLIKAYLAGTSDVPVITRTERIPLESKGVSVDNLTTIYKESNDVVWFGTKDAGLFRITRTKTGDEVKNIRFDKYEEPGLNTIYSITKNIYGTWIGTGGGLIQMEYNKEEVYNESNLYPFNIVHGVLEDNDINLWLATDVGVIRFCPHTLATNLYGQESSKEITVFSENACYKSNGLLVFGGNNGVVAFDANQYLGDAFMPDIDIVGLNLFGKECNLYDYLSVRKGVSRLRFAYDQNVIGVTVVGKDFIYGDNYSYYYKIEELGKDWVNTGSVNVASLSYLSPGEYTLSVKYRNNVTAQQSNPFPIKITIKPFWMFSWWAYSLYVLILLSIAAWFGYKYYMKRRAASLENSTETVNGVFSIQNESTAIATNPVTNNIVELGNVHFSTAEDKEFYEKMLNIIAQQMTDPELSVDAICVELELSSYQLYRKLRRITQKTPNEIIREYRFAAVEELLVTTDLSTDEILSKVGLVSRSNFFKLFSLRHGITPKQYREQERQRKAKKRRGRSS
ncbi:helix-turn-helix domain-containing protein [Bacteroides sp. 214]|uniref:ligand-binding sensor domain-containing protein n=1 Tax=Bacteroides sp. 214 TaxID=2302935 RepID=UPI0013D5ABC6|nr:helix-turn-helix domain-containing protein [Bacteroides sp. 214]NDW11282.1 helix-turn-helix domain-containing protein [Bacteroides sp. 214]